MPNQGETITIAVNRVIRLHAMLTEVLKVADEDIDNAGLRMLTGTVEQVKGQLPDVVGDRLASEADRFFPSEQAPTVSTMRVTLAGMTGWLAGVAVNARFADQVEAPDQQEAQQPPAAPDQPASEGFGLYL